MMKQLATVVVLLMMYTTAQSQAVFTYGKASVSKEEFLRAFNKNPSLEPDRKKALREYLDLYINFKLKVQAAYDAGLDKDPNYAIETDNFKRQLSTNFINDEANIKILIEEAFQRSKKDIHLQQIYIPLVSAKDTLSAYQEAEKAYADLEKGMSFSSVGAKYGVDAATAELGYVTAFTLPYSFENVVYNIGLNRYSRPVRSSSGYHIFLNAGERPAVGRRKVAQILLTFPPGANETERAVIIKRADSIYTALQKDPGLWDEMVHSFSNDVTTAYNHGLMQEFGIGQYSTEFENVAFALRNTGEISKPFETGFGLHILQLKEIIPVPANLDDPMIANSYKERVEKDDRLRLARKLLLNKWIKLTNYKPAVYDQNQLWAYTDTFFAGGSTRQFTKIKDSTVIFTFSKQKVYAVDFAKYVKASRAYAMYQSMSFPELMNEYVRTATTEYYQTHLEEYNTDYNLQLREFNEANLLFGIMDKEVWTKSASDEKGLKTTYEANKTKYKWEPSADAMIFTASNEAILNKLQEKLKSNMQNWRSVIEPFGSMVIADSNRYELGQIPVVERTNFTEGLTTAPVKNNDGSYTFAYIVNVYPQVAQRSFDEARGMVINDYQVVLEKQWLDGLKKKYPVKVNDAVFNALK